MTHGEIIDLLSSDDDDDAIGSCRGAAGLSEAHSNGFPFLHSGFDSLVHGDGDWASVPAKRRRLSPLSQNREERVEPILPSQRQVSYNAKTTITTRPQKERASVNIDEDDPIIFTSSGQEANVISLSVTKSRKGIALEDNKSDDSLPEATLVPAAPRRSNIANLSTKTATFLATLDEVNPRPKSVNGRKRPGEKIGKKESLLSQESNNGITLKGDETVFIPADHSRSKRVKLIEEEQIARVKEKERIKEAKALQRELSREEKAKEKEEDKERKRLLREEKAEEKRKAAELAEVNKSKPDKKDSTPEMIVDLPASLDRSTVDNQTRELMKNLNVDTTTYQSLVPNIVKWRRKMKAKWNSDMEHWEPLEYMMIIDEKHVLCYMSAREFTSLAMSTSEDEDLQTHVTKLKSAYVDCIPIYLIEGLQALLKKSKTAANRAYQVQVLAQDLAEVQPPRHRKRPQPELVDEDKIEDALLRLQIVHECFVCHTTAKTSESAEWIANFTQHISTIPYR